MRHKQSSGYILLATSVIVASIGMLAAVSVLYFATGFIKSNRALERSNQAKGLANACTELAIQKMIATPAFTGTVNNSIATGSCSYVVTKPTGSTILISSTGTVSTVIRKVQVNMNLSPLVVTKWQEVP